MYDGTRRPQSMINLYMQSQLGPPILVGQAIKDGFDSPPPLFLYGNVSIKKTLLYSHELRVWDSIFICLLYKQI